MTEKDASQAQSPTPDWEVRDGRIYIGGADVTEVVGPAVEPQEEEATNKPPPDPVVEGEGEEPEEKAEPEKPEPKPEPKPEQGTEEGKEGKVGEEAKESEPSDKIKVRLKYKGEEYEEELGRQDLSLKLQRLRLLDEKQKQIWEQSKELEPYWEVLRSDWFKEKLKEGYETGELTRPQTPPEPPAQIQYEVIRRQSDPDYDEVMQALQAYAMTLPEKAMRLIDSDPNVFLSEYDRFAKEIRSKRGSEPGRETPGKKESPKPTPEEVKQKLTLKESAKERSQVTKPGTAPPDPPTPRKRWVAKERELVRALKDPKNHHLNLEIAAKLLFHRGLDPDTFKEGAA